MTQTSIHFSPHVQNVLQMERFPPSPPALFIHLFSAARCEALQSAARPKSCVTSGHQRDSEDTEGPLDQPFF